MSLQHNYLLSNKNIHLGPWLKCSSIQTLALLTVHNSPNPGPPDSAPNFCYCEESHESIPIFHVAFLVLFSNYTCLEFNSQRKASFNITLQYYSLDSSGSCETFKKLKYDFQTKIALISSFLIIIWASTMVIIDCMTVKLKHTKKYSTVNQSNMPVNNFQI